MMSTFLSSEEIADLTDRKTKSKQIDYLRSSGIAFFVSATGHPKVLRSTLEGRKEAPQENKWKPNVLRAA